jgi:K+ transporter
MRLEPGAHQARAAIWMVHNAESATEFFRLQTNRVIELGSQVEI